MQSASPPSRLQMVVHRHGGGCSRKNLLPQELVSGYLSKDAEVGAGGPVGTELSEPVCAARGGMWGIS